MTSKMNKTFTDKKTLNEFLKEYEDEQYYKFLDEYKKYGLDYKKYTNPFHKATILLFNLKKEVPIPIVFNINFTGFVRFCLTLFDLHKKITIQEPDIIILEDNNA